MPRWAIGLIVTAGVLIVLFLAVFGWFAYKISRSPDTFVYSGNHVPNHFVQTAHDEGLVKDNEAVLFFYSDALFDVSKAMYILTDQHLVLHNDEWSDPVRIIAFQEVVQASAFWSSNWVEDSWITVDLTDGSQWSFPLSMENGTDRQFVDKLCELAGIPPVP